MTTIDIGITENDLLQSLAAELRAQPQRTTRLPGDFTRRELQEATGKSRDKVAAFLREKVAKGELVGLWVRDNGQTMFVYRKEK